MKKSKLLKPMMVLVLLLISGVWAKTHAQNQGRPISQQELVRYSQVDPHYADNIVLGIDGNYIDNNSIEARNLAKVKADAMEKHELIAPEVQAHRVAALYKKNDFKLPPMSVSGDMNTDVSNYKEVIKVWVPEHQNDIQFLDSQTQAMLKEGNYKGLYKLQLKAGNTK